MTKNQDGTYTTVTTSDVVVIAEGSTVTYTISCEKYPELVQNCLLDGSADNVIASYLIPFDWVAGCGHLTRATEDGTGVSSHNNLRTMYTYTQVGEAQYQFTPTAGLTQLTLVTGGEIYEGDYFTDTCFYLDKIVVIHQDGLDQLTATGTALFEDFSESSYLTHQDIEEFNRGYPGLLELFAGTTPETESETPTVTGPTMSNWAVTIYDDALENGLILESLGNDYTESITRLQFAQVIVNMVEKYTGETLPTGDTSFTDTQDQAILKAAEAEIVGGRGDGTFDPTATATRQEISMIMYKAVVKMEEIAGKTIADSSKTTLTQYTDFEDVDDWAKNSVAILINNQLMGGISETEISPLTTTTIEQCVALVNTLYGK